MNARSAAVDELDHSRIKTVVSAWQTELRFAVPVVSLVLVLFYLWYAVQDRYLTFLYFHDMGPGFDTAPFGEVTASRYWMSGLVAAGAVMVLYTALLFVLGRLQRSFRAPAWMRVWLLCAIPLGLAIPMLVMTVNDPVLPPGNAIQVTAAALAGLALALAPGHLATENPWIVGWLLVDGVGVGVLLLALIRLDSIADWVARGRASMIIAIAIVAAIGVLLLIITTVFIWRRRLQPPKAPAWLASGFAITYLLLPLAHYLLAGGDASTGHFSYITDSANFFARGSLIQLGIWEAVALVVVGLTRLRRRLAARQAA